MKKTAITFVTLFFITFAQHAGLACSGDHWVTSNITQFENDFRSNCCKGSTITVLNLATGLEETFTATENGANATDCISEA